MTQKTKQRLGWVAFYLFVVVFLVMLLLPFKIGRAHV